MTQDVVTMSGGRTVQLCGAINTNMLLERTIRKSLNFYIPPVLNSV